MTVSDAPEMTLEELAELSHFYREGRAFVKGRLPLMAELSQGEVEKIADAFSRSADTIERQQREIDEQHAESEHFARLAFDDLGKNPPRAWKDIAGELKSEIERLTSERDAARNRAIEECAKVAEEKSKSLLRAARHLRELGNMDGSGKAIAAAEETMDVAKAIRALGGQK